MVRALRFAVLVVVSGGAFISWLLAPILDTVSIQGWRAVGLVVAVTIGGIAVPIIRSWVHVDIAVGTGLVAGAAWVEFWFSDVSLGLLDTVAAGVVGYGRKELAPGIAAALVGAWVVHLIVLSPTRLQRIDSDD